MGQGIPPYSNYLCRVLDIADVGTIFNVFRIIVRCWAEIQIYTPYKKMSGYSTSSATYAVIIPWQLKLYVQNFSLLIDIQAVIMENQWI